MLVKGQKTIDMFGLKPENGFDECRQMCCPQRQSTDAHNFDPDYLAWRAYNLFVPYAGHAVQFWIFVVKQMEAVVAIDFEFLF